MTQKSMVLFLLILFATPALAGSWKDCTSKNPDRGIAGCTKIIDAGKGTKQNLAIAYRNRGTAYAKKGEYDKALVDLSAAIKRNNKFADAYYDRGLTYYNMHDAKLAIADFTNAIAFKPKYAFAYNNRGIAYIQLGDFDLAIADFDKSAALDPRNAPAYFNRADAFEKKGEWKRATIDWQRAISLFPAASEWNVKARDRLAKAKANVAN